MKLGERSDVICTFGTVCRCMGQQDAGIVRSLRVIVMGTVGGGATWELW